MTQNLAANSSDCCCCCWMVALIVIPILIIILKKYFGGGVCKVHRDLTGKLVVITGSNTGIGYETAKVLSGAGAEVIMACRSKERTQPAIDRIRSENKDAKVEFMQLDLEKLDSVQNFAQELRKKYKKLDILILNAGIMMLPERKQSKEGHELQFATNHLGHFLLTNLLYDLLKNAKESRVITVSSMAHLFIKGIEWNDIKWEKSYNFNKTYCHSKLANVMFARELHKRGQKDGITSVSLHPGAVRTELERNIKTNKIFNLIFLLITPIKMLMYKTAIQGAQTTIYLAFEDTNKLVGGSYYSDCKVKASSKISTDDKECERLWEYSVGEVKLQERLKSLQEQKQFIKDFLVESNAQVCIQFYLL